MKISKAYNVNSYYNVGATEPFGILITHWSSASLWLWGPSINEPEESRQMFCPFSNIYTIGSAASILLATSPLTSAAASTTSSLSARWSDSLSNWSRLDFNIQPIKYIFLVRELILVHPIGSMWFILVLIWLESQMRTKMILILPIFIFQNTCIIIHEG